MKKTLEIGTRYYKHELNDMGYEQVPSLASPIFTCEKGDVTQYVFTHKISATITLYEVEEIVAAYNSTLNFIRVNDNNIYIGQEIHLYDITDGTETEQIIQNKSVTWENIIPSCNNVNIFFEILTPDLPYENMMVKITDICIDLY